jgi:hypothetical protein
VTDLGAGIWAFANLLFASAAAAVGIALCGLIVLGLLAGYRNWRMFSPGRLAKRLRRVGL